MDRLNGENVKNTLGGGWGVRGGWGVFTCVMWAERTGGLEGIPCLSACGYPLKISVDARCHVTHMKSGSSLDDQGDSFRAP